MCYLCFLGGFFKDDLRKYWRRKWQPAPVFLPEKFHGQESLVGYSPWGPKESDMNKYTHHQTQKQLLLKLMLFLLYLDSLQLQLVHLHSLVSHWLYLTQIIKHQYISGHKLDSTSIFIKFKVDYLWFFWRNYCLTRQKSLFPLGRFQTL